MSGKESARGVWWLRLLVSIGYSINTVAEDYLPLLKKEYSPARDKQFWDMTGLQQRKNLSQAFTSSGDPGVSQEVVMSHTPERDIRYHQGETLSPLSSLLMATMK